ncbi:unnamed protein product, partial [Tilletia laevis]
WELAQLGYFVLDDDEDSWYEEYVPNCRMDGVHTLLEVKNEAKRMSKYDEENLHEILSSSSMRIMSWQRLDALAEPEKYLNERLPLKRSILASSLHEAFSECLVTVIQLPKRLLIYAGSCFRGSLTRFADVKKANVSRGQDISQWRRGEQDPTDGSDTDLMLVYWINGPDSEESRANRSGDGPIAPHWQLVSPETDEVIEILHALQRNLWRHIHDMREWTSEARKQVNYRLRRPAERKERDEFKRWACSRISVRSADRLCAGAGP